MIILNEIGILAAHAGAGEGVFIKAIFDDGKIGESLLDEGNHRRAVSEAGSQVFDASIVCNVLKIEDRVVEGQIKTGVGSGGGVAVSVGVSQINAVAPFRGSVVNSSLDHGIDCDVVHVEVSQIRSVRDVVAKSRRGEGSIIGVG